jgi:VWFA-related protein
MDEIESAFRAINEELQGQYSIAYTSTNPRKDGAFRQVEVRCKQNGVRIKTRKGYYAPKS